MKLVLPPLVDNDYLDWRPALAVYAEHVSGQNVKKVVEVLDVLRCVMKRAYRALDEVDAVFVYQVALLTKLRQDVPCQFGDHLQFRDERGFRVNWHSLFYRYGCPASARSYSRSNQSMWARSDT